MYNTQDSHNLFEFTFDSLEYILRSVSSFNFFDKKGREDRQAYFKALSKLGELARNNKKLETTFEKLGSLPVDSVNSKMLVAEFQEAFATKEFEEFRRIIASIPKNQHRKFMVEVFNRNEAQLLKIRSYASSNIQTMVERKKIEKLVLFDQAIFQLWVLNTQIKKDLLSKSSSKLDKALSHLSAYIVLSVKAFSFAKNTISEEELSKAIAFSNQEVKPENTEELLRYWSALTN